MIMELFSQLRANLFEIMILQYVSIVTWQVYKTSRDHKLTCYQEIIITKLEINKILQKPNCSEDFPLKLTWTL